MMKLLNNRKLKVDPDDTMVRGKVWTMRAPEFLMATAHPPLCKLISAIIRM